MGNPAEAKRKRVRWGETEQRNECALPLEGEAHDMELARAREV